MADVPFVVRARWLRPAGAAVCGLLVAALLVGPVFCWPGSAGSAGQGATPAAAHRPDALPAVEPPPVEGPPAVLAADGVLTAVQEAAAVAGGTVEAVVLDPTGRALVQTPAADRPIPAASLVKLLVVQQLLAREAAGVLRLPPESVALLAPAISSSDDVAMNRLWVAHDGAELVRSAAATFGLTGTAPPAQPGQWGQATTTAADVGRFLSALSADPSVPGGAAVLGWMRSVTPVAADGFDQRFGLLGGGAGAGVAAKQGWMCCVDGRRHLHSAGVLTDGRVVVLLGEAPDAASWSLLGRAVDGAAAALVAGTA